MVSNQWRWLEFVTLCKHSVYLMCCLIQHLTFKRELPLITQSIYVAIWFPELTVIFSFTALTSLFLLRGSWIFSLRLDPHYLNWKYNHWRKLRRYQSNWLRNVKRMNSRMPKTMLSYRPNGRRELGRPLKRLLDEAETGLSRPYSWRMMMMLTFTFSEPCIVILIRENDQRDAHFFSLIYSN